MNSEDIGGEPIDGVSVDSSAQDSSPESTQQPDLTKNLKAEMNRKFSKINEQLTRLVQIVEQSATQKQPSVEEAVDEDAPEYKRYVDARFQQAEQARVKSSQEQAWTKALELFPELNQESENFDQEFYKAADKFYGSFDLQRDPEAPLKAVKLAALELGKIEQLTKEKLLKDEARRSRLIAEGGSTPRESKKEKEPALNEKSLARLGIDPKKLKERIKSNKDRYGE